MDSLIEMVPNWENEILGFNQGTLCVIVGLIILVFATRIIAVKTMPNMFNSLCEKSPVADLEYMVQAKHWEQRLGLQFFGDPVSVLLKAI